MGQVLERPRVVPGSVTVGPAEQRIAHIDGLRAVAVLAVVVEHASRETIRIGQSFGVELFFVISGFCLAYPTLLRIKSEGRAAFDVAAYAVRRIVRILPPYYVAIVVALLFIHFGVPYDAPPGRSLSALDVVRQALFLDHNTILAARAFWSLAVEFRWYFVFPIALWVWTRSPRAFFFICGAAALAAIGTRAYSVDLFVLPAFLLGIVAAHVYVYRHPLARFALPAFVLFAVLAIARTGYDASVLWQCAVFSLVVAAGHVGSLRGSLSFAPIAAVGVVSYSIYLVQTPVIAFAELHGVAALWAGVIAIASGFAFWYVAERPFVKGPLRNRLIAEFEAFLPRWFKIAGIGRLLQLGRV
jgi:peptidoglycan/LPS O-acetylase OafA/YrhL